MARFRPYSPQLLDFTTQNYATFKKVTYKISFSSSQHTIVFIYKMLFIHLLIKYTLIKYLLWARIFARCWKYDGENDIFSAFHLTYSLAGGAR